MRHPPRTAAAALLALALLGAPAAGAVTAAAPPAPPVPSAPAGAPGSTDHSSPFLKGKWGDDTTGEGKAATLVRGSWDPAHDQGSMQYTTKLTGAENVWGKADPNVRGRKLTGHGVTVAVIDTGIAPVEGLAGAGKIVNGPDLSFESQSAATRYVDGYGHGTHMAGIIAGRDSAVRTGNENDDKNFVGMAPDARLLNMKVGSGDGGVDVTQVIAALDWIVQHKAELNVKVVSLSYGTTSTQSPEVDPLAHAVENAWRAGIVVVVSAGNDGQEGGTTLTMPAVDPFVIAVGSTDHGGTDKPEDTRVGAWTNPGTTRKPDLVAPGKSIVSLRVPGSYADRGNPGALIPGDPTQRMFRGTGTSQSAAVVSGAAALLMQRNPTLEPDQVKGLLKAGATRLMRDTSPVQGAGQLNVRRSIELLEGRRIAAYTQSWDTSTGTGSLDLSRGGSHVTDPETGAVLRGNYDAIGGTWDGRRWASLSSSGTAWTGGSWNGRRWAGDTWASDSWAGAAWAGDTWASDSWAGAAWAGDDWAGRRWAGRTWSSMAFQGRRWAGDDWAGRRWAADSWAGRRWAGQLWVPEDSW